MKADFSSNEFALGAFSDDGFATKAFSQKSEFGTKAFSYKDDALRAFSDADVTRAFALKVAKEKPFRRARQVSGSRAHLKPTPRLAKAIGGGNSGEQDVVISVHIPASMRAGEGSKALEVVTGRLNRLARTRAFGTMLVAVDCDRSNINDVCDILDSSGLQWQRD